MSVCPIEFARGAFVFRAIAAGFLQSCQELECIKTGCLSVALYRNSCRRDTFSVGRRSSSYHRTRWPPTHAHIDNLRSQSPLTPKAFRRHRDRDSQPRRRFICERHSGTSSISRQRRSEGLCGRLVDGHSRPATPRRYRRWIFTPDPLTSSRGGAT